MRIVTALGAVCLAAQIVAAQEVSSIRDSQYEWQCEDSNGNLVSGHTRQDKAFQSCYNQALADPGGIYIVRGGTFRVTATGTSPPPEPPPDPPDPPDPGTPDPAPNPQVTFGPVQSLTEYPATISALKQNAFTWELTFTLNSVGTAQGLASRDEYGTAEKGHLSVWVGEAGLINVRNQDIDGGQSSISLQSTTVVQPGVEHIVQIALDDGNGIGLFVDGNLEASEPNAFGLADNDLGLVVGGGCSRCGGPPDDPRNVPDRPIDGTVFMAIWDDPLELPGPNAANLSWLAPTHYVDCEADEDTEVTKCGQPIAPGDLGEFRVYLTVPEAKQVATVEGDVTGYEYVTTRTGEHCFEVTAVADKESDRSNAACKNL